MAPLTGTDQGPVTIFLDACVLYPNLLRGIVLSAATAGAFTPRWSPRVLAEWRIAAARDGGLPAEAEVDSVVARMAAGFPGASVAPDPDVERSLTLPDPADTHVLAAAIATGPGVLLTLNLRDFPARRLSAHGVVPRHPDGFLWEMFSHAPGTIDRAIRESAAAVGLDQTDPIRRALKRARLSRLAKAWAASATLN